MPLKITRNNGNGAELMEHNNYIPEIIFDCHVLSPQISLSSLRRIETSKKKIAEMV